MFADKNVERIFEDRITALSAGVESAVAESLAEARRDVSGRLNKPSAACATPPTSINGRLP